ncbi:MAG: hypothetical protein ACQKBT_07520, partial [Puniceicoccales bacterium]
MPATSRISTNRLLAALTLLCIFTLWPSVLVAVEPAPPPVVISVEPDEPVSEPEPSPSLPRTSVTTFSTEPAIMTLDAGSSVPELYEDAESGTAQVTLVDPTGTASLIQNSVVFEGDYSFQLT